MTPKEVLEEMKNWNVGDDAGLAVFADWLEENGYDKWAYMARTLNIGKAGHYVSFYEWVRMNEHPFRRDGRDVVVPDEAVEYWKNKCLI